MKKLKKLETEETAKVKRASRSLDGDLFDTICEFIDIEDRYHLSF